MNFDGLGIGFEVEDNKSEEKVSGISDSIDELWSSVKRAGTAVPRAAAGITRGLGRMGDRASHYMGTVTTAIGGIVDAAMDPKLDGAYASLYAGYNKEFGALSAGMKDTEGRIEAARKRIGGVAHGMGEDMGQASQSWIAFEKQSIDLEKILGTSGLTGTIKDMIKVTSVFGIEGRQLANVAGSLKRSYGLTEEQIGDLGDKIVAVGTEFQMGREALQSWPQIMAALNKDLAEFGAQLNPKTVDDLTTSIVQLGGGFHEALGVDATQATELAINAFSTLAGERKNIARLAYGMGGPFSDFAKEVMAAGNDLDGLFNVMASGDPLAFMDMLREIGKEAQKQGGNTGVVFQRLNAQIVDTLGPDMAFAVQGNWDAVREKMKGIPKVLDDSKGTMRDVAKAHWKSSLTAGDAWEMMVNNMRDKVFRLSRGEVNRWKKDMRRGFKDSFEVVREFAEDKGPLGEVTRKLLAVQRVGLSALLPELGALAPVLGGITAQALPMMTALGSMGVRFSDIGKLAGVGGGAFLLFELLTKGPDEVIKKFKNMGKSFLDIMDKTIFKDNLIFDHLRGVFDTKGIGGLIDEIPNLVSFSMGDLWGKIWGRTEDIARSLGGVLKRVPWDDVGYKVASLAGKGLRAVVDGIWGAMFGDSEDEAEDAISRLLKDAVRGGIDIMIKTGKGAFRGAWDSIFNADSLEDTFKNILKVATVGFGALAILSSKFRGKILSGLWGGAKMGARGMGSGARWMMGEGGRGGGGDVFYSGLAGMLPMGGESGPAGALRHQGQFPVAPAPLQGEKQRFGGRTMGRRDRMRNWISNKKERIGRSRIGRAVGGAKNMMGAVGGAGGVMAMSGLFEGVSQLSERTKNIQKIALSAMLSDQDKFLLKSEEGFLGVANTIDAMFMGLPSTIGEMLGVTKDDLTGFYHHMVASGETAIYATVETFQFLGRSAVKVWENVSANAEMAFARVSHGFEIIKIDATGMLYDIGEYIESTFSGLGAKIMYPFEWFSFKMKGWMADFIEDIFGKPGESNAITEMLSTVMGGDAVRDLQGYGEDARKAQKQLLSGEATFEDAWVKREKRRQDKEREIWQNRRKDIAGDRKDINDRFSETKKSLESTMRRTGLDAISDDWDKTKKDIGAYSGLREQEANKNVQRSKNARKTIGVEDRMKAAAMAKAAGSKQRTAGVPTAKDRAEATKSSKEIAKILDDNRKQVEEFKQALVQMGSSVQEAANRPIQVNSTVKVNEREIGKAVETFQRNNTRL